MKMPPRQPQSSKRGTWLWVLILTIVIAAALFAFLQRGAGGLAGLPGFFGLPGIAGGPASGAGQGGAGQGGEQGAAGSAANGAGTGAVDAEGRPLDPVAAAQAAAAQAAAEQAAAEQAAAAAKLEAEAAQARREGPRYALPPGVAQADDPTLPERSRSDAPILDSLSGIAPRAELGRFGNIGDFTRRVVITVDNLPRERVPAQYSVVQRIPGPLAVVKEGEGFELSADNYRRYDAFVSFAVSVGAKQLASVYLRFYPLFQQEYRLIGFPDGHFHDRVIDAIDDMLSAPTPEGPIRLRQPKVYYVFDDPVLEKLSAGRKIMIRIGPDNAARIRGLLRGLRNELTVAPERR
jgi:hypothetical protein